MEVPDERAGAGTEPAAAIMPAPIAGFTTTIAAPRIAPPQAEVLGRGVVPFDLQIAVGILVRTATAV